jgi:hypothetical protein
LPFRDDVFIVTMFVVANLTISDRIEVLCSVEKVISGISITQKLKGSLQSILFIGGARNRFGYNEKFNDTTVGYEHRCN